MRSVVGHILALGLLLPAAAAADGWVELAASYYNPDWELRESETGVRASGEYGYEHWFVGASYNTIDTAPVDLPVRRLRGLAFGNWRELSAGRNFALRGAMSLRLVAAYQGVTLDGETRSGYSIGTALAGRAQRVSWSLGISYLELEEQDWRVTGQLSVPTGERTALVIRIDDFAEFDFTWYEIGVRFHLGANM